MRDVISQVSEERLNICKGCPKQSDNAKLEGYTTLRPDLHCTSCGCTLIAKSKALSAKCPLDKWLAYITEEERIKLEQDLINNNG